MEENPLHGAVLVPKPQEVFTQLALCGSETWNNWRAGKLSDQESEQLATKLELKALPPPGASVDFSDIDFSSGGMPDFTDMDFGDNADFRRTAFEREASFYGATFGEKAQFQGAIFGDFAEFDDTTFGFFAQFQGVTFGDRTQFDGATFKDLAQFSGATFGNNTQFDGATFGDMANFSGATFGDLTQFNSATFGALAKFSGATFGRNAQFNNVTFGPFVRFAGATFDILALFAGATFKGDVDFSGQLPEFLKVDLERLAARIGIENQYEWVIERLANAVPEVFQNISFSQCRFTGLADFSNREFKASVNFRDSSFRTLPLFANVKGSENIDPTGMSIRHVSAPTIPFLSWHIKYEWTNDSAIASRARILRKIMDECKAHDVERHLFIIERRLERGPLWKRNPPVAAVHTLALFLFGALSNYGRSIVAPLAWLGIAFFGFHALTQRVFDTAFSGQPRGFWDGRLLELSLGNALPIFGTLGGNRRALLTELFPTGIPTAVELLSVGHSLVSVALIFLLLLAIRNFFKIG